MNSMSFLKSDLPDDINSYLHAGLFSDATRLIEIYKKRNISSLLRERLEFELLRMDMIKDQYTYSFDEGLRTMQSKVKDFKEEELSNLIDERYVDWHLINGEIFLSRSFFDNIIKVNPSIKQRLIESPPLDLSGEARQRAVNEIIEKGKLSYYIHLKTGLKIINRDKIKGEKIRVHIPVPRGAQQIKNIKIINGNIDYTSLSPESHPQRTIYFQGASHEISEFTVEYSYENHVVYNQLDFDIVSNIQPNFYTQEELPHIKFSPFLLALAKDLVKDERNPLRKARIIYDYITTNVQYSFVKKYSAIPSIAESCAYNLKGDCGLQALLFITLLRILGIPARWQSGLYVNPHYIGCHDWAEFYIEPYGWLYADPSFGGGARRNGDMIGWNFYFGNLDPFRMVANGEFHYPLYPEKTFLRADPYDNQMGEGETDVMDLNGYVQEIMEIIQVRKL